jgi:putative ABC transport system ATP-binding protein
VVCVSHDWKLGFHNIRPEFGFPDVLNNADYNLYDGFTGEKEGFVISFSNVSLTKGEKTILNGCTFTAAEGDKLAVTGESGSGKTTILRMIMGAEIPGSGEILFRGERITAANIAAVRSEIAFIGQEPALGTETIGEALMLPFTFKSNLLKKPSEEKVKSLLGSLKLDDGIETKRCSQVSGGEKQRVAIARAVLLGKTIFLADEITSALDKSVVGEVFEMLNKPEYTMISVSHDLEWINRCGRVLKLESGCIREVI